MAEGKGKEVVNFDRERDELLKEFVTLAYIGTLADDTPFDAQGIDVRETYLTSTGITWTMMIESILWLKSTICGLESPKDPSRPLPHINIIWRKVLRLLENTLQQKS